MDGIGTPGVELIPKTQEDIEMTCVHVWRDQSEEDGVINQECIRCKKNRNLTLN